MKCTCIYLVGAIAHLVCSNKLCPYMELNNAHMMYITNKSDMIDRLSGLKLKSS
jgi:hypothetical protein